MKVVFEFPDDAWAGIVESLTEGRHQPFVPNPAYNGNDPTIPMQIANPKTKEETAHAVVLEFITSRYKEWGTRTQLAPVQQQVQAAVETRASQVLAATTVTVEA